jgi:hypothetical protein
MNTAAHLRRVSLCLTAVVTLLLTGATGSWAGPAPLEPEPARGVPPATGTGAGGTPAWEVVTIASASAALAVIVTLLVMLVVLHHRATHRPAPA